MHFVRVVRLFSMSKIQIFESNSQRASVVARPFDVVFDVKDTNFWKQFTTAVNLFLWKSKLFSMSKIQIFESNSQQGVQLADNNEGCFRCQRYKFLKAIHNANRIIVWLKLLFSMSKIQIFESNSQPLRYPSSWNVSCFRCQRYKFLKAIHNKRAHLQYICSLFSMSKIQIFESNSQLKFVFLFLQPVVFDVKDTNFWKQFTTELTSELKNQ